MLYYEDMDRLENRKKGAHENRYKKLYLESYRRGDNQKFFLTLPLWNKTTEQRANLIKLKLI